MNPFRSIPLPLLPALMGLVALTTLTAAGAARAIEFKSIGAAPAVLYDAPSERGRKVFVAPRGMPVEVVLSYGEWTKVRDAGGDLTWVESKALSAKRHVVASVPGAKVRAAASDSSAVVFVADKGVLLEMAEGPASGWIKVRHRDGETGYVKAGEVWGE
jgi:SH3-like domain-containing protein